MGEKVELRIRDAAVPSDKLYRLTEVEIIDGSLEELKKNETPVKVRVNRAYWCDERGVYYKENEELVFDIEMFKL